MSVCMSVYIWRKRERDRGRERERERERGILRALAQLSKLWINIFVVASTQLNVGLQELEP